MLTYYGDFRQKFKHKTERKLTRNCDKIFVKKGGFFAALYITGKIPLSPSTYAVAIMYSKALEAAPLALTIIRLSFRSAVSQL